MGYEINLHIGRKYNFSHEENGEGMTEVAKFDLSKPGSGKLLDLLHVEKNKENATKAYLWASDGDTKLTTDRYGDQLVHIDPKAILKAIRADHKENPYRVYALVIPYLRNAIKVYGSESLTCVMFGH